MSNKFLFITMLVCMTALSFQAAVASKHKGKVKTVEESIMIEIPSYLSYEQACREALIKAQNQAIEKEFGSSVTRKDNVVVSNVNGKSETHYLSFNEGEVRGVWLGDTAEPIFERMLVDGKLWLKVTVKGRVREITNAGIQYEVETLRVMPDQNLATSTFKSGDDFFLYFRSPADGFLTVFLFDVTSGNVYCMLPYQSSGLGAYHITHDEDYYLFAPNKAKPEDGVVDEFVMTCSEENVEEFSELYVIFSPNNYGKATSKTERQRLSDDLDIPSSLKYKDFNEWLIKNRQRDEEMQIKRIPILVKKELPSNSAK